MRLLCLTLTIMAIWVVNSTPFASVNKLEKLQEIEKVESLSSIEIPKRLIGTWKLDVKASEELISKQVKENSKMAKFLPELVKLNGELTQEFTTKKFIISDNNKQMSFDISFIQQVKDGYVIDLKLDGQSDSITILPLADGGIQIISPHLLGSQFFSWKK